MADCQVSSEYLVNIGAWAVGITTAIVTQVVLNAFSTKAQYLKDRLDEICETAETLSETALNYWKMEGNDPALLKAEADLHCANHKLNALAGTIYLTKPELQSQLDSLILNLSIAATGGDFQVNGRAANPRIYVDVQQRTMALVTRIRTYQRKPAYRIFG